MSLSDFWTNTKNSLAGSVGSSLDAKSSYIAGSVSTDPYLQNRKYTVVISQNLEKETLVVVGAVPKDFQFDQRSKWSSPWGAGILGSGMAGDLLALTTGNRLVAQSMSLKVWQGTADDTSFTVDFDLIAYSSTDNDVMQPLRSLMRMVVPSIDTNGFLKSPGAILDSAAMEEIGQKLVSFASATTGAVAKSATNMLNGDTGIVTGVQQVGSSTAKALGDSKLTRKEFLEKYMKNIIQVDVGDWFTLKNVAITDVSYTFHAQQPGPRGGLMSASVRVTFEPMFTITAEDIEKLISSRPVGSGQ